jgi:hypothetical protein
MNQLDQTPAHHRNELAFASQEERHQREV